MASVIDLIGNTPLVELKTVSKNAAVKIFAKLEGNNPGGSVKDRPARNMILKAIERGSLQAGMKLVEATSGNTGIALAMISNLVGIEIDLVMPENSTIERVKTMKAYGAKVILTPEEKGMEGAIDHANTLINGGGYFNLNQFENPDNYDAHYKTTGPEIWNDTQHKVTHFVSAMGTTGTIMGVSRFLKEQNKTIKIIGAQPKDGSKIPGIRKWSKEYLPKIFEPNRVDQIVDVSEDEAIAMTKYLTLHEGIFCGISSGGAAHIAKKISEEISSGIIVFIVCDRGDRYLSGELF